MTGPVWQRLETALDGGPIHLTLCDPDSSSTEEGVEIATRAAELGTHAFMVGGSTGVNQGNLDDLVVGIKDATDHPVIHFPSSAGAISPHVDAIFFMSTLNSGSTRYLVDEQVAGAMAVRDLGIEPIGLGYIVVEPGMTVGRVSEARLITRDDAGAQLAARYALAAEYFGMRLAYLEAGSGADEPVPPSHVRAVTDAAEIPILVGGGIRTGKQAEELLEAGASAVVTGTVAEDGEFERLAAIVDAVDRARAG